MGGPVGNEMFGQRFASRLQGPTQRQMTCMKIQGGRTSVFGDSDCSDQGYGKFFTKFLEKQEKQLEKVHKIQIKNVKAVAMQEAVEFVKKKGQSVAELLTEEQSKMTRQFLKFK